MTDLPENLEKTIRAMVTEAVHQDGVSQHDVRQIARQELRSLLLRALHMSEAKEVPYG
jgi:hypothetical protein